MKSENVKIWREEPIWFVDILILLQEEIDVDEKWMNQSTRPGSQKKEFVVIDVEPLLELLDPWREDQWRHNDLINDRWCHTDLTKCWRIQL